MAQASENSRPPSNASRMSLTSISISMCGPCPGPLASVRTSASTVFNTGTAALNTVTSKAMPRSRRAVATVSTSPRPKSLNIA